MSKYLLWDIDDADLEYQFTKEELQNVDIIEMINLDIRGGYSEYILPLDIEAGKSLTIYNRSFGLGISGNYYNIKFKLKPDSTANKAYYWFFFKEQIATFFFNGSYWVPNFNAIKPVVGLNIFKDRTEYGYLDVKDYFDKEKKILFSNLDMKNFKQDISGLFFRHNDKTQFGKIQKQDIIKHTHILPEHTHEFKVAQYITTNVTSDLRYIMLVQEKQDIAANGKWYEQISAGIWFAIQMSLNGMKFWPIFDWNSNMQDGTAQSEMNQLALQTVTSSTTIKSLPSNTSLKEIGGETTNPKNMQGTYVIKAW